MSGFNHKPEQCPLQTLFSLQHHHHQLCQMLPSGLHEQDYLRLFSQHFLLPGEGGKKHISLETANLDSARTDMKVQFMESIYLPIIQ